ncbi:hypothetical protein Tco_1220638 [Tanacetum coccineum]
MESSSEGTGVSPRVPDESTVIPATSSEGTGTKPGAPNEEKVSFKANIVLNWGSKQASEYFKEDQGDDDEKIKWNDDEDEVMSNAEDADTGNGDEEIKDDIKKVELPPSGSSLSVSSGFGYQFLNLSSDNSLIGTVIDTTDTEINSLLDVQIQQEIPHIQSPSILNIPVYVISEPSILTPIPETPSVAPVTTLLPPPSVSTLSPILLQTTTPIPTPPIITEAPPVTTIPNILLAINQRVSVLEKDVQVIKEVDHNATLLASLRAKIPSAVNAYLGSSLGDALQKVLQRHTEELIQQYPHQAVSEFATPVIQSTVNKAPEKTPTSLAQSSSQAQSSHKAAKSLSEYELKMILFEKMDKSRSYLSHDKHQALFDDLLNSISLDDAIEHGQAYPEKVLRKRDHDDEDPSAGPN